MRWLDKWNLRPAERRLVVAVGLMLFIMINLWLVRPHFKDWARVKIELAKAQTNLVLYQSEVALTKELELKLKNLERQGAVVRPADQAVDLILKIQNQARISKVNVTQTRQAATSTGAKTNQFFEEQSVIISVDTGDKELVDFLYAMGSGDSMIRVKDLDLKPDPTGVRLQGSVTLVASYQRKAPAASPPAGVVAATVRPGAPGGTATRTPTPPVPRATNAGTARAPTNSAANLVKPSATKQPERRNAPTNVPAWGVSPPPNKF